MYRLIAIAGVVVGFVFPALADEGSGHNANQNVSMEPTELADGRTLLRIHDASIVMGNEPGNPFHLSAMDCYSSYVIETDGTGEGNGYCDGIDQEGDVWTIIGGGDLTGGTWKITGGTGKFKDMTGGGTYKISAEMPGGRSLTIWEGSWTTK